MLAIDVGTALRSNRHYGANSHVGEALNHGVVRPRRDKELVLWIAQLCVPHDITVETLIVTAGQHIVNEHCLVAELVIGEVGTEMRLPRTACQPRQARDASAF